MTVIAQRAAKVVGMALAVCSTCQQAQPDRALSCRNCGTAMSPRGNGLGAPGGPTMSPDGRSWWDGTAWQPFAALGPPPAYPSGYVLVEKKRSSGPATVGCLVVVLLIGVIAVLNNNSSRNSPAATGGGSTLAPVTTVTPVPTADRDRYISVVNAEKSAVGDSLSLASTACDGAGMPATTALVRDCTAAWAQIQTNAEGFEHDMATVAVPGCDQAADTELKAAFTALWNASKIIVPAGATGNVQRFISGLQGSAGVISAASAHLSRANTLFGVAQC